MVVHDGGPGTGQGVRSNPVKKFFTRFVETRGPVSGLGTEPGSVIEIFPVRPSPRHSCLPL